MIEQKNVTNSYYESSSKVYLVKEIEPMAGRK